MPAVLDAEARAIALAAYMDFPSFCRLIQRYEPVIDSALNSEGGRTIVDALTDLDAGRTKRLIINLPPRHAKSYIATQLFTAWFLGRHPGADSILATHTARYSERLAGRVRDWTQDPLYRATFGTTLKEDTRAKGQWTLQHAKGSSQLFAVGVDGPVVGRGISGLGLIDDPIKKVKQATNPRVLDEQFEWYRQEFETRLDSEEARILIIMQRWSEDDLCGRLLREEPQAWTVVKIPAIIDEGTPRERVPWPDRHNLAGMQTRRSRMAARWWSALYQQEPAVSEERPFAAVKAWADGGKLAGRGRVSAYFDPAWGGEDWACFVAGVKVGADFVVTFARVWQEQIGQSKARMLEAYSKSGADRMRIERNAKGEAFYDAARAAGIQAQGIDNTENKYYRIERHLVRAWPNVYFWLDGGEIDKTYLTHLKQFSPPEDWKIKIPRADAADATAGWVQMAGGMSGPLTIAEGLP